MNEPKKLDARYGEIWRTAKGHRVKVLIGPGSATTIETVYLDGKVDGFNGANFDLYGNAIMGSDKLVERIG